MLIIITLFAQLYVRVGILYVQYDNLFVMLYVRVGILYVHYNNAVRPVICEGWYYNEYIKYQPSHITERTGYHNEHIKYQPSHITGRTALL
jgi:archaellum component FlaF (FlaF/FlaG flagellin family)